MEKEGLIGSLSFLKEYGVQIGSFSISRNPGITKPMRVNEPVVKGYFDVFHVSKSSFDNASQFISSKFNNVS